MVLVDAIRWHNPTAAARRTFDVALIALGSVFVAITAQAEIPLPWSPVPITGQTLGVLLVGAALGARRGMLALGAYLAEGTAGLPFFAGGASGVAHLLGPSGGYLVAFPLAAGIAGFLAERGWDRRFVTAMAAMLIAEASIYAIGVPWLARFVGGVNLWTVGVLPYLPGAVIKAGVAAALLPFAWKIVGESSEPRI